MPPFVKPKFKYEWDVEKELGAIKRLQQAPTFGIPSVNKRELLIATWNIANLDTQRRTAECYELIAQIIRPFDLIAVQEVNADLGGLRSIMKILGSRFACVFSDEAGNEERMCYVYKPDRLQPSEQFGELEIPPPRNYWLPFENKNGKQIKMYFEKFSRTPYTVAWKFRSLTFVTYNCHLYFGDTVKGKINKFRRRILEVEALARWINERRTRHRKKLYSTNILLLGDMNIPMMHPSDPVYARLLKHNMEPLEYHNHMEEGSNLKGDKYYSQLVFAEPFSENAKLIRYGIFAFDNVVFEELYRPAEAEAQEKKIKPRETTAYRPFLDYVKWAISDHRVLWLKLEVD